MKKLLLTIFSLFVLGFSIFPATTYAQEYTPTSEESGLIASFICSFNKMTVSVRANSCEEIKDPCLLEMCSKVQNQRKFNGGGFSTNPTTGQIYSPGLLGVQGNIISLAFQSQPSSREYIADILDNVGVPTISSAYAQGTGYSAMSPFLPIWKVFRNLAYSLYIIMFIVIGVMIMLRTKVNAQTIISIQSALPNLIITLILITFSYAIVGFMIDLMYFLIYFVVYLMNTSGLIDSPTKAIDRLLNYNAWSVIFEGRNSIISAVGAAISEVLTGLGSGAIELAGRLLSMFSIMYLIVAVAFAIAMLKLMFALIKSYVMLLVQLVTAPIQILFNALPGSKAFSTWLKTTASYLIPFPVAAAMFIFAAILVGDPTQSTILNSVGGDANHFGVSSLSLTDGDKIWLPPFTLTGGIGFGGHDILVIIGFFVFLMTPAAVKMAQDWLQVKESPYTSEAFANLQGGFAPMQAGVGIIKHRYQMEEQKRIYGSIGKATSDPNAVKESTGSRGLTSR